MSLTAESLKKIKKKYYELNRIREYLSELQPKIEKQYKKLDKLEKKMNKEFKEYDQLEGKSLKGFFYKVLGSKEEQIEKERQQYIQASLKYEEFRKTVELSDYERSLLEKKLSKLEGIEAEYQALIKRREKELLRSNSSAGKRLLNILKKKEENEQLIFNIRKTSALAKKAIQYVKQMEQQLQAAKNWGNWDMYGGGRRSGWAKYSAIDRAKNLSYQTQHILGQLENGLYQIYGNSARVDFNIQMDTFSRFTDIFFDNLISDWIVQRKISNSLHNVRAVSDKVVRVVQSLDQDIRELTVENKSLEKQRKSIIENS